LKKTVTEKDLIAGILRVDFALILGVAFDLD